MNRNGKATLLLKRWRGDVRLRVYHMVLLMAILNIWLAQEGEGAISVSRRVLMEATHIGGIGTYHRCIKDLRLFGYIDYNPSYHPMHGSRISLVLK